MLKNAFTRGLFFLFAVLIAMPIEAGQIQLVNNTARSTYQNVSDVLSVGCWDAYANNTGVTQSVWTSIVWYNETGDYVVQEYCDGWEVLAGDGCLVSAVDSFTMDNQTIGATVRVVFTWGDNTGKLGESEVSFGYDG